MILTLVLWLVLVCGGMTVMLYVASHKTIVIADVAQEQSELSGTQGTGQKATGKKLLLQHDSKAERNICIPLPKGTKAEYVVMENRYMEQELWIYLQDAAPGFYEENTIYGDIFPIQKGIAEESQNGVILKLKMTDVLEYHSTMDNDLLTIAFSEPGELYDMIVVVDPMGGGDDSGIVVDGYKEKSLTLDVAKCLQKKIDQTGIKLYFTRLEDETVSDESRLRLIDQVDADIYIGIRASQHTQNPEQYGIHSYYNEAYFIPEFGNVELADILTRNVTIAASNKATGLILAEKDSILRQIEIPAAQVSLGYLTNAQENALLRQEDYQQKLAEGLANTIIEVYTGE